MTTDGRKTSTQKNWLIPDPSKRIQVARFKNKKQAIFPKEASTWFLTWDK